MLDNNDTEAIEKKKREEEENKERVESGSNETPAREWEGAAGADHSALDDVTNL